jgi:hypothetical protein
MLRALQGNTVGSIGPGADSVGSDTHLAGRPGFWRSELPRPRIFVGFTLDHSALEHGLVEVMAGALAGGSVNVDLVAGKSHLPRPLAARVRVRTPGPTVARPSRHPASGRSRSGAGRPATARRAPLATAGRMVTRSLAPLPSRTTIWFIPKSMSCTLRRQHSSRRRPIAGVDQRGALKMKLKLKDKKSERRATQASHLAAPGGAGEGCLPGTVASAEPRSRNATDLVAPLRAREHRNAACPRETPLPSHARRL